MKVHAFMFVCLVLGARGASINLHVEGELGPLNNVEKSQDVNQISVDKAENNLRNVVEIPVGKSEEHNNQINNYNVPDMKENTVIKSAETDLTIEDSNQQLEESQNLNNKIETDIVKLKIEKIQSLVNLYNNSISKMFESPAQTNEDLAVIQCEVQNFKDLFSNQLVDLKNTIESYINTRSSNLKTQSNSDNSPSEVDIHSSLKKLTADFEKEMTVVSDAFDQLFSSEAIKGKAETSSGDTSGSTSGSTAVVSSGSSAGSTSISTGDASTTSTTAAPTTNTKPTTSISQNQFLNAAYNYWNTFITTINSQISNIYQNYWAPSSSGNKS